MMNRVQGHRGTVLLAEGDVLIRMPLAQYLRECGYKVLEATTLDEAKLALGDANSAMSVVVSSLQLAGNGFGISNWVKQHRPDLNVLLTGTPRRVAAGLCSDDSVPTPLKPQLLLRRIRQMLATRKGAERGRAATEFV